MRTDNERGIALISVLLVMMMISALLIGFTTMTISDQRGRFVDRERNQSFYAAAAGLEKMTADLGNLFFTNVAPSTAQVNALTTNPPVIDNITYLRPDSTSGYQIASQFLGSTTISTGPYSGLYALITRYTMDVTARTPAGGDTHLQRQTETVAIPVFQFGIFSDVDLSFSAAADFDFGGRVHTNGNLFLAQGGAAGSTLTLADKVTAVGEIVRQRLSNGVSIDDTGSTRTVRVARSPGVYRTLARTEGSVVQGIGSALNEPTWTPLSIGTYNSYIRNGRTGARRLDLPLVGLGGANTDLTRRPAVNEHVDNTSLYGQRLWTKASLRILLSDTANDITSLPGVTATPPVQLDGNWNTAVPNNGTAYGPIDASHPPIARSQALVTGTLNGNVVANAAIIPLDGAAIPAAFMPGRLAANNLTVTILGVPTTVTCQGREVVAGPPVSYRFTNCGNHIAIPLLSTVSTVIDSVTVTTTVTVDEVLNSANIRVASIAGFGQEHYWLNNSLVTCLGNTPTTLRNCTGTPAANDNALVTTNAMSNVDTGLIGGFIKIEKQSTTGVWTDVTMQILNHGIGGPNLSGAICADPTPNAIIRLQRLRDNNGTCNYAGTLRATNYWPNTLFDSRESLMRDFNPGTCATLAACTVNLGGVMHYIALDVDNLAQWFAGQAPYNAGVNGTDARTDVSAQGYTVYFSDRRNNRNASNLETGEYGWEDFVNNGVADGVPNGTLDSGEDLNANGVLDLYGGFPNYQGTYNTLPPGWPAGTYRPTTAITPARAKVNRAILFRRALKLVNGSSIADSITGLTVATENPVYIQGDYNAAGAWTVAHSATSIIADSATMLSNNWIDNNSFDSPYSTGGRARSSDTWYRVAIIAGKGAIFNEPNDLANGTTFGTDGGTHSFIRFLEGNSVGGNNMIHYRGSLATFYYNRQAVGPFKCCGGRVYDVPTREYIFDTDFLNPALLPPNTPMFRDVNTIGFSQEIRPGR